MVIVAELFEHIELTVEGLDPGGVFDPEVVAEDLHACDTPVSLCLDVLEEVGILLVPKLDPGGSEKIKETLGGAVGRRVVKQPLQCEVGGGPSCLSRRCGHLEMIDRPELEQLRAVLEVGGPARGQCLEEFRVVGSGCDRHCVSNIDLG